MPKLTAKKVDSLKDQGFYGDGEGLYLKVGTGGAKSWILRTMVHGRRRDLGLGSASLTSLAEARVKAREYRKIAREGGDPDAVRRRVSITFEDAARQVHSQLLPTWRSERHGKIWFRVIENYAVPTLGKRPLHTVGVADVLSVLSPIWIEKHETAKRLRQRLSTIFDWAKGAGHYPHENPLNGIKKALPRVNRRVKHMAALDWHDIPAFMGDLSERKGVSARTLEFLILTATRSGEARGMRWSEISLEDRVWIIPGERMKRGVPHRVPLSEAAVAVLKSVSDLDGDFVFPSIQRGKNGETKPQSVMVFKALMKRMGREGITVHGMRSSFRDWCSERAHADWEVAEAALSHATGNEVERAYARSDLFERRRTLMDAWARYTKGNGGNVAELARA